MFKYVVKKILQMIPLLLAVIIFTFFIVRMIPGDPVALMLGKGASVEAVEHAREELGYNDPLIEQLLRYINNVLHGNLGTSLRSGEDIFGEIMRVFPVTLKLALFSTLFSTVFGVLLGVLSAVHRGKFLDNLIRVLTLISISMPSFFLGLVFIIVFSLKLGWLPSYGSSSWKHFIMPVISLGLMELGYIARTTRSSMLDVLGQDYIRTARAKGLRERTVIYSEALRNALIPIATSVGLRFGTLLAGAAITETVFSLRGIGLTMIEAVTIRDYTYIQSCILVVAVVFVVVNTLVDILYTLIDPRIKLN